MLLAWLAALACVVVSIGAIREFGTSRAGVGTAAIAGAFAYALARRELAALILWVLVSAVGLLLSVLAILEGEIYYGWLSAAGAALFLGVLGRAVLRELGWWSA